MNSLQVASFKKSINASFEGTEYQTGQLTKETGILDMQTHLIEKEEEYMFSTGTCQYSLSL